MLTEIATIAGAVTALITLGVFVYKKQKAKEVEKNIELGRSLEKQIQEAKTNEERAELAKLLDSHKSK